MYFFCQMQRKEIRNLESGADHFNTKQTLLAMNYLMVKPANVKIIYTIHLITTKTKFGQNTDNSIAILASLYIKSCWGAFFRM